MEPSGSIISPMSVTSMMVGLLCLLHMSQEVLLGGGKFYFATFLSVLSRWELVPIQTPSRFFPGEKSAWQLQGTEYPGTTGKFAFIHSSHRSQKSWARFNSPKELNRISKISANVV